MAQVRPGVSQIIFKSTGGNFSQDVTIDGNKLSTDTTATLEQIVAATAKGGVKHNENASFDFEMQCSDYDNLSALKDHKNEYGDLEIYELGDTTTPVLTLTNVNPIIKESANFDPSAEGGQMFTIQIQGVNTI